MGLGGSGEEASEQAQETAAGGGRQAKKNWAHV